MNGIEHELVNRMVYKVVLHNVLLGEVIVVNVYGAHTGESQEENEETPGGVE